MTTYGVTTTEVALQQSSCSCVAGEFGSTVHSRTMTKGLVIGAIAAAGLENCKRMALQSKNLWMRQEASLEQMICVDK
jgi:hypothetical protein